jgi:hypothetical protein
LITAPRTLHVVASSVLVSYIVRSMRIFNLDHRQVNTHISRYSMITTGTLQEVENVQDASHVFRNFECLSRDRFSVLILNEIIIRFEIVEINSAKKSAPKCSCHFTTMT